MTNCAMAASSHFFWISLWILLCVFQASDSRSVTTSASHTLNPELEDRISKIPPILREGIDPQNVNVTSAVIKSGAGAEEPLSRLQQEKLCNTQLGHEAFGLKRKVRLLEQRLSVCSSTASAVTHSYYTQLNNNLKQLLGTLHGSASLILNTIALSREVITLQKRVKHIANSTETSSAIGVLQRELLEKIHELNVKKLGIQKHSQNSGLILQIISLQNQIWDLEQAAPRRGQTSLQHLTALQQQLDRKINELRDKGDAGSVVLQIISLLSRIPVMEKLISDHVDKSKADIAYYERQLRQKGELLTLKVRQLSDNERNTELTKDILVLQAQMNNFRLLKDNIKQEADSQLKDLRISLEELTKQEENSQKQLEEANNTQAQLIMKVIGVMNDLREMQDDEQQQTPTLETVLQAKDREYAKAKAKINELQRKLQLKTDGCSGFQERYDEIKTELDQKTEELKRTGDETAPILTLITLHDELKTLRDQIFTTEDPDRISELQRQLEMKQVELNSKAADVQRVTANSKIILTIIKLQNEMWDLQKRGLNETSRARVQELQNRVEGLITEIDDNENTKLILNILAQSHLLTTTQVSHDLRAKREEVEKYVNELREKNQDNADLILTVIDLQNLLRNVDLENPNKGQSTSATINRLREQLRAKAEEHSRDQAKIKALQNEVNHTKTQCSNTEQKPNEMHNDLETKLNELKSKSDSATSLALLVSALTVQVEELKKQLQNTKSETKIKDLLKIIDEKTNELARKTHALRAVSAQPYRFVTIITLQTEIEKLADVAKNRTDYLKIQELQDHLNNLIDGIQDENNENTKLMFQILAQHDEIARLKRQKESQTKAELEKIKDLESELEDIRNQIKEKTLYLLYSSATRIANLSTEIVDLHMKIKPLKAEILSLKEAHAENLKELQKRLDVTTRKLQDNENQLKNTDATHFKLIMEVADLRTELKKAQGQASQAAAQNTSDLAEVKQLRMCCTDANSQRAALQRQLKKSQEDADCLQRELEEQTMANNKLHDDNNNLRSEKSKLEDDIRDLLNRQADLENKTIHASKITFDPDTAHQTIALSAENTEMSTGGDARNTHDHPGRYNVVLAALGVPGFSGGRHYWEVSVAGKPCYHLGMASESAPRRGAVAFSPANGYWTIVLDKQGRYKAVDGRFVRFAVKTQPQTLGILLDYKHGQISFYDANARSHMYSFVGQNFKDKIYPFVRFCIDDDASQTPIMLLPAGSVNWIV